MLRFKKKQKKTNPSLITNYFPSAIPTSTVTPSKWTDVTNISLPAPRMLFSEPATTSSTTSAKKISIKPCATSSTTSSESTTSPRIVDEDDFYEYDEEDYEFDSKDMLVKKVFNEFYTSRA